jgi:hypothetical protein
LPVALISALLRWRGRHPQPGDKRQDFLEHLSRHRDLGHLEGNVAAMADPTFAPILISFSRSLVCDHGAAVFGVER